MEKIISKNLLPGRSYRVRATGVDSDGKTITSQVYILKTKGKSNAPPNVTNLSADFKGKTLVVTWNGDAARAEKDFKHFRVRVTSPNHSGITKNYYTDSNVFKFQEDQNRDAFSSFEGNLVITVFSIDRTGNQSSGVSVSVTSEPPTAPTNVKLSAAVLGYNVTWDFPTFPNYKETRIYHSTTQNGTYTLALTAYGSGGFVSLASLSERWVKVAHVNLADVESERVASVPPNITPIDPVSSDVTPPAEPTNLNWEDAGLDTSNGITTANMRAHWEVSEITSGYKVRVTEDVTNKENWAVYDVPASRATVTNKSISGGVATLTVTAHSFATDDYVTVFNLGSPFDGKKKITSVTTNTLSFAVTGGDLAQTADPGDVVISSYTVKGLTPGKQHYGAILAYDSANNLTQFVSEGTFTTSGTAGSVGSAITIPGTTMAFGPNAGGIGKTGLHINSSNYWYNTGNFNVGTSGNSVSWDGVRLRLDGSIVTRGGAFTGNVFLSSQKSGVSVVSGSRTSNIITLTTSIDHGFNPGDKVNITGTPTAYTGNDFVILDVPTTTTFTYEKTGTNISQQSVSLQATLVSPDTTSSLIAAEYYNVQSASYSGGVGTIILSETPSNWVVGNSILVSLTSSIFDGQYVITSISGDTITFKMSPSVGSPSPITNAGRVANLSAGDRVIFNSNGIQALEGDQVLFSINRSRSHKIGGFNIKPAKIDAGEGADSITIASSGTWRIWAGSDTAATAPFRVSGAGNVRAYGKFSSSNLDTGTRVVIGSEVSGTKSGIIIDDTTESGIENFWYIPSTVDSGGIFFQVGTESGSGITVKKVMVGQSAYPKVFIKDYNIQGTNVFEANGILDLGNGIKLGKDLDGAGNDGLKFNSYNYWYYDRVDGGNLQYKFRVGNSGNQYIRFQDGVLTVSGDINVVGGNAATTSQLASKLESSAFTGLNIISAVNSGVLNDNTGNGIQIGNVISGGVVYPRISTISALPATNPSSTPGYNTSSGTGFFLGRVNETVDGIVRPYQFFIGKANGQFLLWNGSSLEINGSIKTKTGSSNYLYANGNSLQFYKLGSPNDTLIGSIYVNNIQSRAAAVGDATSTPSDVLYVNSTVLDVLSDIDVQHIVLSATSSITGIGNKSSSESIDKVLVRISGDTPRGKYLRWADTSDIGGSGTATYQAGTGIRINTDTNPDKIINTGYRRQGSQPDDGNRISYATLGTSAPGTSADWTAGDLHIEY